MFDFPRRPNDCGVNFVASKDVSDPRTITAEELALLAEINALSHWSPNRLKFQSEPVLRLTNQLLEVKGHLTSAIYNSHNFAIDTTIAIPVRNAAGSEHFYLTTFLAIVGGSIDPSLDLLTQSYSGATLVRGGENARRLRCFWAIVSSSDSLRLDDFKSSIAEPGEVLEQFHSPIGVVESDPDRESGVEHSTGVRIYFKDPNFVVGTYWILKDSLEFMPLASIKYYRDRVSDGYYWGETSSAIAPSEELKVLARFANTPSPMTLLTRLMEGKSLYGNYRKRAVLNAIIGQSDPLVSPHPGMTANSPNGSKIVANDQRIFYCNQARIQTNAVQHLTVEASSDGSPMVTATLNTEHPAGTIFSRDFSWHRIYSEDGREQNESGSWSDLGSDRSLSWFGNHTSELEVGDRVIVAPAIEFQAGGGFELPFSRIKAVYYNGRSLNPENIRCARGEDLEAYEAPADSEEFIVVWGSERAALHYIYHASSITTDNAGVAKVSESDLGCFAFIEGVEGRIDAPVHLGLEPNRSYNCLTYYPPRSQSELWQFEVEYVPYQGMGLEGLNLLEGACVISAPVFLLHSMGGGLSVHRGESSWSRSAASFHLPRNSQQYPCYQLDSPIRLYGEVYPGPIVAREINPLYGIELTMPRIGARIHAKSRGIHFKASLNVCLTIGSDRALGYRLPHLESQSEPLQAVCAFLIQNKDQKGLVVVTHNQKGGSDLSFDTATGAAIDVFPVLS